MPKICKINHWKTLFSSKNLLGKETKEEEKRPKKGEALIRGGAHIRDNTVPTATVDWDRIGEAGHGA